MLTHCGLSLTGKTSTPLISKEIVYFINDDSNYHKLDQKNISPKLYIKLIVFP